MLTGDGVTLTAILLIGNPFNLAAISIRNIFKRQGTDIKKKVHTSIHNDT